MVGPTIRVIADDRDRRRRIEELASSSVRDNRLFIISERTVAGCCVDLLIVEATPRRARQALDAIAAGEAEGAVLSDELEGIADLLDRGIAVLPRRLLALSRRMPNVTERGETVLSGLAVHRSNRELACASHMSLAILKRELVILRTELGVGSRAELRMAAERLGFAPSLA